MRLKVVKGDRWSQRSGDLVTVSRVFSDAERPFVLTTDLTQLLDPAPALAGWRLRAGAEGRLLDRPTLNVTADHISAPDFVSDGFGAGADRHALVVDLETGIVLEAISSRDGLSVWSAAITTLDLAPALEAPLFSLRI